jgi:hypothetical protein
MLTPAFRSLMRQLGVACVTVAVIALCGSLVIFATGFEPAFLGMIAALGVFTLGIGALAVARE